MIETLGRMIFASVLCIIFINCNLACADEIHPAPPTQPLGTTTQTTQDPNTQETNTKSPYTLVLGVAQDGGYPQAGCKKSCCQRAWADAKNRKHVSCLAIIDPITNERWMIDATPDFREQLRMIDEAVPSKSSPGLSGILLTHAHVGHYAGLIHLGREVLGAKEVPIFAMPRMRQFLETNGPWNQLVELQQVRLRRIASAQEVRLNDRIRVVPFLVPHRDEYSETVGYKIMGPSNVVLFLPDIDKWERWDVAIEDLLKDADVAYLDGTFFDANELPGRDLSEIPHPLIVESIERFKTLPLDERVKVRFIHANHSNPVINPESESAERVRDAGHRFAEQGERVEL